MADLPDVETTTSQGPSKARPFLLFALAVVVLVALVMAVRIWRFMSTHEATDDATLTTDLTAVAPQVTGIITKVLVDDNQRVKAGQLLVILDDSNYRAAVLQAKANLDAAIAQAKGAGVNVKLMTETGQAQVLQAQGGVAQGEGGVATANADVASAQAAVATARANADSAGANIQTAQAAVTGAISNKQHTRDLVNSAKAALDAAQADYERINRDAQRYATLAAQGAVSQQTADQAESSARAAQALVAQRKADLSGATQQLQAADADITQARAKFAAAREQAKAAQAGVAQAQAQRSAAIQNVRVAQARTQQAVGMLDQARTSPRQVAVSRTAASQAQAKIEQARAALTTAELQLSYTRIYAPVAGQISKKSADVGALVQPGTPLMAIVEPNEAWVVANFKETQLSNMHRGQSAEVDVDAFPGRTFRGHVDSLAAATGATFALLPPDNATGNFTKVVQRVPVKIDLEPGQPGLSNLRAGMSVVATVETR